MARKLMGIHFKGYTWPERLVAVDLLTEIKDLDHRIPTSMIVDPVHDDVSRLPPLCFQVYLVIIPVSGPFWCR